MYFILQLLEEKNELTKQTGKILMRRLIKEAVSSGFPLFANVFPNLPDVRIYPTLPYDGYDQSEFGRSY